MTLKEKLILEQRLTDAVIAEVKEWRGPLPILNPGDLAVTMREVNRYLQKQAAPLRDNSPTVHREEDFLADYTLIGPSMKEMDTMQAVIDFIRNKIEATQSTGAGVSPEEQL